MAECLDIRASQSAFAELVGISQQAVSKQVEKGALSEGATLGQWLLEYCERLRGEAAGRGGDDNQSLTKARAREASLKADLIEVQLAEKLGELVPIEEIEPRLVAMVVAARTELMTMADKLCQQIKTRYGVEIDPDLIDEHVNTALAHLAAHDPDAAGDDGSDQGGVGAAA